MKKPLVGVIPLVDEERESLWMLPGYLDGLAAAGALPVVLPLTTDPAQLSQLAQTVDGFLFTGGHDVNPWVYGEQPLPQCGSPCPQRDMMEGDLLKLAIALNKPLLGICRGIQFINAALGGTLWQDLPTQNPSQLEHHMSPPYHRAVHRVTLVQGSPLHQLVGADTLGVNSYHHQGVKEVAPGLEVMARADDGLAEAIRLPGHRFLWAVQWHPEFSWRQEPSSLAILKAFVQACEE